MIDQIKWIIAHYNEHKEQLLVMYLVFQTIAKAAHDSIESNKDKKGTAKIFGVVYSFTMYLGIGKRAK